MSFAWSPLCDLPGIYEFHGIDSPLEPQPNPYQNVPDEDLPRQNLEPPVQQVSEQAKPPYMFRLPDELIVRVLNQLGGNDRIVSLLILRRVSQRLRRIVYEASIWRGIERDQGRQPFTEFPGECRLLIEGDISSIQWVGLKQGLRGDRSTLPKCAACRATPPRDLGEPESCRFVGTNVAAAEETRSKDSAYHCDGCHTHHPRAAFSQSQWDKPHNDGEGGKICIGGQGQVRLCEHVRIGWEDVEKHVELWKGQSEYCARRADSNSVASTGGKLVSMTLRFVATTQVTSSALRPVPKTRGLEQYWTACGRTAAKGLTRMRSAAVSLCWFWNGR